MTKQKKQKSKIVLVLMMIGICSIAKTFAAIDIGIDGGVNLSESDNINNTKIKPAGIGGLSLRIGNITGFKTGAIFSVYDYNYASSHIEWVNSVSKKFIEIPLMFDISSKSEKTRVHPHGSIGIIPGICLKKKELLLKQNDLGGYDTTVQYDGRPTKYNQDMFDIRMAVSLGFGIQIGAGRLSLDEQCSYGTDFYQKGCYSTLIGYSLPITALKKKPPESLIK